MTETNPRIGEIESLMATPDFWKDKDKAQALIKELQELKTVVEGGGKYDKANAIITIFSGVGFKADQPCFTPMKVVNKIRAALINLMIIDLQFNNR